MAATIVPLILALIVGFVILIVGVAASSRLEAQKREKEKLSQRGPLTKNTQPPHDVVPKATEALPSAPVIRKTAGPATVKLPEFPATATIAINPAQPILHSGLIFARTAQGSPISSENRNEWLEARRWGVTATDVKKIVKLNGQPSIQRTGLLEKKLSGARDPDFAVFQHGRDREPIIAEWARQEFGVVHNQFLMCGTNASHLATPDGYGEEFIVEIKTSVKDVLPTSKMYRDQLQWQLHVTNTEKVLLIVENRYSLERDHMWVHRNEERIQTLARHADCFLEELRAGRT
jgi:hypothetical protein